MTTLPIYIVHAFTKKTFAGNPAAVCPLREWLPDALMQAIAAENHLAETAFFVPAGDGFHLRWFTPAVEVDLCGHATLATAHVLANHLGFVRAEMRFESKSGPLLVRRAGGLLELDFPARPPTMCGAPAALLGGLRAPVPPHEVGRARDYLAVFDDERTVHALAPDFATLRTLDCLGIIATAPGHPGSGVDFVSRFFAPAAGIDEDPVTGSSHCTLVPYWAARLGKTTLHALQVSARGGELFCTHAGDRVRIAGHAVTYVAGEMTV
jgi:predicted PhzF superfamily epimerase YddE/YHI9